MDFETYAMCKPLGRTIPAVTLTFDGNIGDKVTIDGTLFGADEGVVYVRISPNFYDLTKASSFTGVSGEMEESAPIDGSDFTAQFFQASSSIENRDMILVASFATDDVFVFKGTYVVMIPASGTYVSKIEFPEIVQTIEPKYIPNYIPMVVLTTVAPVSADGIGTALGDEEGAALDEAAETGMPFVLRFTEIGGTTQTVLMQRTETSSGDVWYAENFYGWVALSKADGVWGCLYVNTD